MVRLGQHLVHAARVRERHEAEASAETKSGDGRGAMSTGGPHRPHRRRFVPRGGPAPGRKVLSGWGGRRGGEEEEGWKGEGAAYLERLVVGSRMTMHSRISPNLLK